MSIKQKIIKYVSPALCVGGLLLYANSVENKHVREELSDNILKQVTVRADTKFERTKDGQWDIYSPLHVKLTLIDENNYRFRDITFSGRGEWYDAGCTTTPEEGVVYHFGVINDGYMDEYMGKN